MPPLHPKDVLRGSILVITHQDFVNCGNGGALKSEALSKKKITEAGVAFTTTLKSEKLDTQFAKHLLVAWKGDSRSELRCIEGAGHTSSGWEKEPPT
jgi:hypothetical protein